ncbi:helix-turn-helix domain-containing protein [Paenibacillus oleatilyticus]|uniref:Helix-turn-helix domain-containing protein n=1 Tax=Paenibacillus oleatilyticus TaxID=2594886 RepID=A0ABV4VCD2_9BACL
MINNLQFLIDTNQTNISKMAKELRVSRSSIYRILEGGVPSAELMLKISNYFKKDPRDIFFIQDVRHVERKKRGAS